MMRRLEVAGTMVDPIDLGDGRAVSGFVDHGYGAAWAVGFVDRDHRVGFAYRGDQMGGYGDARARELTLALRTSIGA